MKSKRRGRMSPRRAALVVALILVGIAALYQGGRMWEKSQEKPETRADHRQRFAYDHTMDIDGVTYRQRKDITTVLLLGVDHSSQAVTTGFRNGGQADFIRLLVIDPKAKKVSQLEIDRDTMTPITILGVLGDKSGVRTAQLSLSHGFGDGKEQSCQLTLEAVSNLLFGTEVHFYLAMNMDGIAQFNDSIGGVTVRVEDDLTALDPALQPGATIRLQGAQAEAFVRSRMNVGSGTNAERMGRQRQYISQASTVLGDRVRQDQQFIGNLYDDLAPYLTTNLSRGRMINEVWAAKDYDHDEVISIKGEHIIGSDGFTQFYADEGALKQTVLSLFYEPIQ